MSVEGVGGKAAAISFPITPATPAQQLETQAPAVKPARRRHFDRARPQPLAPAPFVLSSAALAYQAGIALVLQVGRNAAFAPGGRKSSQVQKDDAEYEESPAVLAHDDPDRLSGLRDQLAQLPPTELKRVRELAERARGQGFGFVVEPLELPAPPGSQSEANLRLSPAEIDTALARHGRIYVGQLTSIPKPPPAVGSYQVVDAKAPDTEAIISYEALRSYLRIYS